MQIDLCVQHHPQWLPDPSSSGFDPVDIYQAANSIQPDTWQQWFEQWLSVLNPTLSPIQAYALTLRLTDDAEIQRLNATYRHQDRPTDVLAFAALETQAPQAASWAVLPVELGDIVISVETAWAQAQARHHRLQLELAWLASHGVLHLLGWDHPDADRLHQMLNQQKLLLVAVGLSPPQYQLNA